MSSRIQEDFNLLSTKAFSEKGSKQDNLKAHFEKVNGKPKPAASSKKRSNASKTKSKQQSKQVDIKKLLRLKKVKKLELYVHRFNECAKFASTIKNAHKLTEEEIDDLLSLCQMEVEYNSIFQNGFEIVKVVNKGFEALGNSPVVQSFLDIDVNPFDGLDAIITRCYNDNEDMKKTFDCVFIQYAEYLTCNPMLQLVKAYAALLATTVLVNKHKSNNNKKNIKTKSNGKGKEKK